RCLPPIVSRPDSARAERASGRASRFRPSFKKADAELIAVDPGQLAAAKRLAGRRKNQEEFLEVDSLDRVGDRELGSSDSGIQHHARLAPGAVDRNHLNINTAGKFDAIILASLNIYRHRNTTTSGNLGASLQTGIYCGAVTRTPQIRCPIHARRNANLLNTMETARRHGRRSGCD